MKGDPATSCSLETIPSIIVTSALETESILHFCGKHPGLYWIVDKCLDIPDDNDGPPVAVVRALPFGLEFLLSDWRWTITQQGQVIDETNRIC